MSLKPDLKVDTHLPDFTGDLSKAISDPLLTGLFLGAPVRIEESNSEVIRFQGTGGFLSSSPGRGELALQQQPEGYRLSISLWGPGPRRRCFLWGVLSGALIATMAALALGWLISWSIPAAMITAIAVDRGCWRAWRARMSRGIGAILHNVLKISTTSPGGPSPPQP